MKNELKILTNVFLNTADNNFTPVNIYFSSLIQKVERVTSREFSWNDLKALENRKTIVKSLPSRTLSGNARIIEGNYNFVIPGTIDPHVHFDTPGFEFRDTFDEASTAAAFGGVTTIIDMPCTSLPPVTSKENFLTKLEAVENRSLIDFAFWGGVCRNDFDEFKNIEKQINELNELGVAGYKTYLISGMDTFKDLNIEQMKLAAKFIKSTDKPHAVHAEDKYMIESRRLEFQSNNRDEWRHYCLARDPIAEEKAIKDMIKIAGEVGHKVHVVHLSSELGLNVIRKAQKEGITVTSETCPHYLHFTQDDFEKESIRNYLKTAPPVKMKKDMNALWRGLEDGTLSFVTTDHAGCNPEEEKSSENFWKVYGGIPGVEHRVPFLFSEGFIKGKLNFEQTVNLLSKNVSEYFNLKQKGSIKEGFHADFALINLSDSEIVKSENMHSKGKYTPFEGIEFNCIVEKTILRGQTIMDRYNKSDEQIGYGNFIRIYQ